MSVSTGLYSFSFFVLAQIAFHINYIRYVSTLKGIFILLFLNSSNDSTPGQIPTVFVTHESLEA